MFQHLFVGKLNRFFVISNNHTFWIRLQIFPSATSKIKSLFKVIDNSIIKHFKYWGLSERFFDINLKRINRVWKTHYSLLYGDGTYASSYYIVREKNQILILVLSVNRYHKYLKTLVVYDGPNDQSPKVKANKRRKMIMSTFQAYVEFYFKIGYEEEYSLFVHEESITHYNIHIDNASLTLISLNICGSNTVVLYCVISVTTSASYYLNFTMLNMTLNIPNEYDCMLGGLSYYQNQVQEMSLCDTFNKVHLYNSVQKSPMDFVSNGTKVIMVVYGYHPYITNFDFTLGISRTPCMGIFPCRLG